MTGRQQFEQSVQLVGNVHRRTGKAGGLAGPKLFGVLAAVMDRIPDEDLAELARRKITVAPLEWAKANVRSWASECTAPAYAAPLWAEGRYEDNSGRSGPLPCCVGWLVALSHGYELLPKRTAIEVLSHEFAHVFLKHALQHESKTHEARELEAQEQQVRWGFGRFVIGAMEDDLRRPELDAAQRARLEAALPRLKALAEEEAAPSEGTARG